MGGDGEEEEEGVWGRRRRAVGEEEAVKLLDSPALLHNSNTLLDCRVTAVNTLTRSVTRERTTVH